MPNAVHNAKTKANHGSRSGGKARSKKLPARKKARKPDVGAATRRLRPETQGKAQAKISDLDPSNSYRTSGIMPAG